MLLQLLEADEFEVNTSTRVKRGIRLMTAGICVTRNINKAIIGTNKNQTIACGDDIVIFKNRCNNLSIIENNEGKGERSFRYE